MNTTPAPEPTPTNPARAATSGGPAGAAGGLPDWLARPARAAESAGPRIVPVAFAARVSTDDQQDPTLSLPRQLAACQRGLPEGMVIVAHFYDVESGRTDLDARGRGDAHTKFDLPIPRDGGIDELLAEAKRPGRRFDAVICESVDRLARITYYGTKIEHELEQAGVLLLASDEPIVTTKRRATAVLTRRMKQGIAEWYVLDMLEKAWGGLRIGERLGYRQIAEHLNGDLALYPPPTPTDPGRALGRWSGSSVREILHNPKYTGHMVWNRRATKKGGKVNPVTDWILSDEPTHPAIIAAEQFAAAAAVAQHRERSTSGSRPNRHPATRRTYTLRSYVRCTMCGRRMFGKVVKRNTYYACQPPDGRRPDGHPVSVLVPEVPLLGFLGDFFNTRLLGPDRADHLAASMTDLDQDTGAEYVRRLAALDRQLTDLTAKQARLLRQAEDAEPGDPFAAGLRARYNELDLQRRDAEQQRQALAEQPPPPSPATAQNLLARLPLGSLDPTGLPDEILRGLCDAFRITISHDRTTRRVHYTAEIEAGTISHLRDRLATPHLQICDVPPAGFEPALPPPEGRCNAGLGFLWQATASRGASVGSGVASCALGFVPGTGPWSPRLGWSWYGWKGVRCRVCADFLIRGGRRSGVA